MVRFTESLAAVVKIATGPQIMSADFDFERTNESFSEEFRLAPGRQMGSRSGFRKG